MELHIGLEVEALSVSRFPVADGGFHRMQNIAIFIIQVDFKYEFPEG